MKKGLIAFDIDGTLLKKGDSLLSSKVVEQLEELVSSDWSILFATGRNWNWAYESLRTIPFPYKAAVLNGALLRHHPSGETLYAKSLPLSLCHAIDQEVSHIDSVGFVVHAQDEVYWNAARFTPGMQAHMEKRQRKQKGEWKCVDAFHDIPHKHVWALSYFFQEKETAQHVSAYLEKSYEISSPLMEDAFSENIHIVQVTDKEANKGTALSFCTESFHAPVIAVGDDRNDLSLFQKASFSYTFSHSPYAVQEAADIVLDSTSHERALDELFAMIKELTEWKSTLS